MDALENGYRQFWYVENISRGVKTISAEQFGHARDIMALEGMPLDYVPEIPAGANFYDVDARLVKDTIVAAYRLKDANLGDPTADIPKMAFCILGQDRNAIKHRAKEYELPLEGIVLS